MKNELTIGKAKEQIKDIIPAHISIEENIEVRESYCSIKDKSVFVRFIINPSLYDCQLAYTKTVLDYMSIRKKLDNYFSRMDSLYEFDDILSDEDADEYNSLYEAYTNACDELNAKYDAFQKEKAKAGGLEEK